MTEIITEGGFVTLEGQKIKKGGGDLQGHYAFPVIVNEDICCGCRMCEAACENKSISFDEKKGVVTINEIACKGCGACVAVCPAGALSQRYLRDEQVFAAIDSDREIESCELCPLSVAVDFEVPGQEKRLIGLVCAAQADPFIILRCFESGADGVMVINCCSGGKGDRERAEKSVKVAKELMETLGMNPERVHLEWISPLEQGFDKKMAEFVSRI
ncbi:MAG TPA: hydrogenase iron-sulfur subunit [Candidatus Bathyarchaeia archaeon]|nr:hydrogenase iron-sulfur subunit [Candidatus Bathyarchaeia archaeon]